MYLQVYLEPPISQVRTRYTRPMAIVERSTLSPASRALTVDLSDVLCTVVSKPE